LANQSASLSDRGRRKNNEDFAAFFEPADPGELRDSGSLYIVADGVGGAAKGERASQFAAQKVLYEYYQPENIDLEPLERLRLILERANDEIYDYASQNNTRMATTIIAAVVRAGFLYVANVGDSRAYLIRDGAAQQINRDHSIVGEMVEHGEMTEADAMISKIKNRITRSLGGDPEVTVEVYSPIQLKTGDKILLCSDGLTRYALREDIAKMTAQGTVEETAQRLVEFANKSGGADNVSVIMTSYQDTSVIVPTVQIARPKQVDLDTLVTQPGEEIKIISRKRQSVNAILFVGVIIVILVFGFIAIKSIINSLSTTQTSTATPETITPAPTSTPESIQATQAQPPSPIDTPKPPALQLPTNSPEGIPINITLPTANKLCLAEVKDNRPNLITVLTDFQLSYDSGTTYFKCVEYTKDSTLCNEKQKIEKNDAGNPIVSLGDYIIIPNITEESQCKNGGGIFVDDKIPK